MNVLNYLDDGFILANKSWKIVLISVLLSILSHVFTELSNTSFKWVFEVFGSIILFLSVVYYLSLPTFLDRVQKGKKVAIPFIVTYLKQNVRRAFVPLIVLFVIFIAVLLVIMIIFLIGEGDPSAFSIPFHPIHWFFGFIMYLLTVVSLFFSFEKKKIFRALQLSLQFSVRNIKDLFMLIVLWYVFSSLYVYVTFQPVWIKALSAFLVEYVSIGLIATTLLYYQNAKKK